LRTANYLLILTILNYFPRLKITNKYDKSMVSIIIAEDHPIFKDGLKNLIKKDISLFLKDEVESSEELMSKLMSDKYDLVITDINLPGRSGIDVLPDIKKMFPKLPVLVLSMHSEEKIGLRAIKAGADGYLSKESNPDEILKAIQTLSTGRKYITQYLAEKLAFEYNKDSEKPPHELLSTREFEVMRLIALGKPIKEISVMLSLSINTVNTYRNRIMEKMCLDSNIEIARYVFENKLLD
jgi:two-component system, NarL family, invasion response regulator UvrY